MHIRSIAVLAALAIPLAAQVPTEAVLVLESTQLAEPYFKLVDALGRGRTIVREQNVFMAVTSVAVDPATNSRFFFMGSATSLAGTWESTLGALAKIGQATWGPWSQAAAQRIEVGANRIVTLESNGNLEAYGKIPGLPARNLTIPQANDIAVFGDLLYTAVLNAASPAPVFEHDLITNTSRTVGNYTGATAIAVSPLGTELCVGTQAGDLLRIDTTSGNVTSTQSTSLGPITAVGYTRFFTIVYTNGTELWSELVPGAPIYVSPTAILDFGVGVAAGPSVVTYGAGCGLGAISDWTSTGEPTLGSTTFALGLENAPAQSPSVLALGTNRNVWSATNQTLPFDLQQFGAPGCEILADPQFTVFTFTNAVGEVDQPIAIPSSAGFVGYEFDAQWFVLDAASGSLGVAVTEGVAFVVN